MKNLADILALDGPAGPPTETPVAESPAETPVAESAETPVAESPKPKPKRKTKKDEEAS